MKILRIPSHFFCIRAILLIMSVIKHVDLIMCMKDVTHLKLFAYMNKYIIAECTI